MWEEWYIPYMYYVGATSLTSALRLQGVDIPDVLTVVQWRAPKDLNTLMQRFGRAGRDFSLQAVVILLAEPKWFLEDYQKMLARKRKRTEKQKKKVSRSTRRAVTGARTSDVSSLESESDFEGETSLNASNKNNNIPDGDGEGTSNVEEAIKSISITAVAGGAGRGSK
jgi:superfamily II DNA helicase RecQ